MRDKAFHRMMISHRAAVNALEEISKALTGYPRAEFWGYERGQAGEYDNCVHSMAREVRAMRAEVEEYRLLKKALKPIIKGI